MAYNSVQVGNSLTLQIKTLNTADQAVNPTSGPMLSIYDSSNPPWNSGSIARVINASTTAPGSGEDHGVITQIAQGTYNYTYNVASGSTTGVWWAVWSAIIEGQNITQNIRFVVTGEETDQFTINTLNTPKHSIKGLVGSSVTFDVVLFAGGSPKNPVVGSCYAEIWSPRNNSGERSKISTISAMNTEDIGSFTVTWTIPNSATVSDDWEIRWFADFSNLGASYESNAVLVDSEYFEVTSYLGPVYGDFGTYSSINDVRFTFPPVDTFLSCYPDKSSRDSLISYALKRAHEWLNEQLSLQQIRASSEDRRQIETDYAVYLLLRGNYYGKRSESGGSMPSWITMWKKGVDDQYKNKR